MFGFYSNRLGCLGSLLVSVIGTVLLIVILTVLFFTTVIDSMDPEYGSGSNIAGVGLVFILGMTVLGLGVIIMIVQAVRNPGFFRGESLRRGASDGTEEEVDAATAA